MDEDRRDRGGGRHFVPPPQNFKPPPTVRVFRRPRHQTPQETVDQYWNRLNSRYPGKVLTVLPNDPYARQKAEKTPHGTVSGQRAAKSYEEARAECERDVDRIIEECKRLNQKYRDLHFDIEWDLKSGQRNCLDGLSIPGEDMKPKGVKRVTDIFEDPKFYINGPTSGDVRQGRDGDCYLMAALCGLGNMDGLIGKVCIKHDLNIGVYGFVFFRDGEWQHCIIDDKLYLKHPDWWESQDERAVWDDSNRVDGEEDYRKAHQTGSRALYFAQCSDENETWLPLLEKAYAKAHGDYASIDGGFTGEAIEDLTGGVTTEIYSTDILDKDAFWTNELMKVGKEFLFGCATGFYSNWLDTSLAPRERDGISEGHAYSIMDAREVNGQRLLKLRNPWGRKEWTGRWSDGSSEWTPEWMQILDHKFGNDGIFWISYDDLLKKYQHFDRTRIFGPEWNVTQCWTNLDVSWAAQYHSTKFSITLSEKTRVVIVLAQLDDAYFGGLEGGYGYDLHFRLESSQKENENDYIVRSNGNYAMARSVSTDVELEAGTYHVLMKITATRKTEKDHLEDVLPIYAATRREKFIQMGLSYDLAHAKGTIVETKEERQQRKELERSRKAKAREKLKEKKKNEAFKRWKIKKQLHNREKERFEKKERAEAARLARFNQGRQVMRNGLRQDRGHEDDRNLFYNTTRRSETFDDAFEDHDPAAHVLGRRRLGSQATRTSRFRGSNHSTNNDDESRRGARQASHDRYIPYQVEDDVANDIRSRGPEEEVAHVQWFNGEVITVKRNKKSENAGVPLNNEFSALDVSGSGLGNEARGDPIVATLSNVIEETDAERQVHAGRNPEAGQNFSELRSSQEAGQMSRSTQSSAIADVQNAHSMDGMPSQSVQMNGADAVTNLRPMSSQPPLSRLARFQGDRSTAWNRRVTDSPIALEGFRTPRRSDTLDTTAAMLDVGTSATPEVYDEISTNLNIDRLDMNEDQGAVSDADSFPSFDWNSELDMSPASDSSSDSSTYPQIQQRQRIHRDFPVRRRRRHRSPPREIIGNPFHPGPPRSPPSPGAPAPIWAEHIDGPDEPWNAVCVVGLRVYSTLKDDGVKLKVLRPNPHVDDTDADEVHGDPNGDLLANGAANGEDRFESSPITLDPDDMARGAVAAMPESTGHVVDDRV